MRVNYINVLDHLGRQINNYSQEDLIYKVIVVFS